MNDANGQIPPESTPEASAKPRRRRVSRQRVRDARAALNFLAESERLDGRTVAARTLEAYETALTAHLGGDLSEVLRLKVGLVARQAVIAEIVGEWVLTKFPINRRRRCLLPVVEEFMAMDAKLFAMLDALGDERREPPVDWMWRTPARPDAVTQRKVRRSGT
jgi:hypothetical protein